METFVKIVYDKNLIHQYIKPFISLSLNQVLVALILLEYCDVYNKYGTSQ